MKKFVLLVATFVVSATTFADGLTATLQQGDVMTPFYGVDAFKQAYEAADSGAVITLSSGRFNTVTAIDKPMTIVGAYAFDPSDPRTTILPGLSIKANNVKVEGIYFSGQVTLGGIKNCYIKRCYISYQLYASVNHINTLIDQCVVISDSAIKNGYNYSIKNSTLFSFSQTNTTSNIAYITNCVVWDWYDGSSSTPYAIYKNNMLGGRKSIPGSVNTGLSSLSEFYNNIFFEVSDVNKHVNI